MKKAMLALLLALALVAGSMGVATFAAEPDEVKITIVHTNDVHARVDVEPYAAALVKEKKAAGENVLLLSAGDVLHGQPIATTTRGMNIVQVMNAAGYDAIVPGNHDFNYGYGRLLVLSKQMNFPVLAANVTTNTSGANTFTPYIIKNIDGVKVGIFGLATPETATKTNPLNVTALTFENPVTSAKATVDQLRRVEECDVVIALAHLGVDGETWDQERSTAVAAVEGIDLIVDGHSHTKWDNGYRVGSTLLVQTGEYGENIGVVELTVSGGKVRRKTASLVEVPSPDADDDAEADTTEMVPDATVAALIERLRAANETLTSEVVGSTSVNLQGDREFARKQETNLGNLITDAMLYETKADIAITNGGGIRDSIAAGDVTMGDILTVLPFGNYIVTKNMTGKAIIEALEHGVASYPELAGGFPQVAGIKFTFDASAPAGSRIVEVTLKNGTELNPDAVYTVATNDFMAVGGDDYTMIGDAGGMMIYSALDEALIDYMRTSPTIKAGPEGRINVKGQPVVADETETEAQVEAEAEAEAEAAAESVEAGTADEGEGEAAA